MVAITILAAVGTALIPLVNALFAPKKPRPAYLNAPPVAPVPQPWPTYADGVTPLPVMPDGSPDWNAYYTGYPSNVSQAIAPVGADGSARCRRGSSRRRHRRRLRQQPPQPAATRAIRRLRRCRRDP